MEILYSKPRYPERQTLKESGTFTPKYAVSSCIRPQASVTLTTKDVSPKMATLVVVVVSPVLHAYCKGVVPKSTKTLQGHERPGAIHQAIVDDVGHGIVLVILEDQNGIVDRAQLTTVLHRHDEGIYPSVRTQGRYNGIGRLPSIPEVRERWRSTTQRVCPEHDGIRWTRKGPCLVIYQRGCLEGHKCTWFLC